MELTVYHLKTCDTCRKAIRELTEGGHTLNLIEVRETQLSPDNLRGVADQVGWETLLNTRSTTWRNLDVAPASQLDEERAIALMCEHPTLIKRPVILSPEGATVGWGEDVRKKYGV